MRSGQLSNYLLLLLSQGSLLFFLQLKGEAVALVDALAPPDFILNSPIGHSNGKVVKFLASVYRNL